MAPKDLFSGHANIYATYRPVYPKSLFDFIFKHVRSKNVAWDCATGNGQVAVQLAKHFRQVYATDISREQISKAVKKNNLFYDIAAAERTSFSDNQFDLITVGQALHWFDQKQFYHEVERTLKPEGILAVWGYALLSIDPEIDQHFLWFYNELGPYWDEARKLVEDEYKTIDFPFPKIEAPCFSIEVFWNLEQFGGYLSSWSATQKFINTNHWNPVPDFLKSLYPLWNNEEIKRVTFPVFLRLGRKH